MLKKINNNKKKSRVSIFQPSKMKTDFLLFSPRSSDVSGARWRVSWPRTDRPSTVLPCSLPARTHLTPTTRRATACHRTVSPSKLSLPLNVPMHFIKVFQKSVNVAQSKSWWSRDVKRDRMSVGALHFSFQICHLLSEALCSDASARTCAAARKRVIKPVGRRGPNKNNQD